MLSKREEIFIPEYESDNLRKYLLSAGYIFLEILTEILLEPSILFQLVEKTQEKSIDINMKAYKNMISEHFGRHEEGAQYTDGNGISKQKLQYITQLLV
jgi:hypothetical protein